MLISREPTIYNVTLATAGTEYSQVLQGDITETSVKKLQIKSRQSADLLYAYATMGNYITIPAGQTKWEDDIDKRMFTLYLKGTVDGQVAEIEVWN